MFQKFVSSLFRTQIFFSPVRNGFIHSCNTDCALSTILNGDTIVNKIGKVPIHSNFCDLGNLGINKAYFVCVLHSKTLLTPWQL